VPEAGIDDKAVFLIGSQRDLALRQDRGIAATASKLTERLPPEQRSGARAAAMMQLLDKKLTELANQTLDLQINQPGQDEKTRRILGAVKQTAPRFVSSWAWMIAKQFDNLSDDDRYHLDQLCTATGYPFAPDSLRQLSNIPALRDELLAQRQRKQQLLAGKEQALIAGVREGARERLQKMAEELASRSERIRSGNIGELEKTEQDMLNRHEPVLRHYLGVEQVHPEQIYRDLLGLLGELATFSSESKRPRLDSRYQHSDQGASFRKLMDAIRQVLSMVLEQHAIELLLQQRQYGIQVSPLHDHKLLGTASFVLAASAQCDSETLRTRLPAHLKIGPVERIRQLVNLHLPGIRLKPLPVAPRQIPFHAGKTYFALELSAEDQAQLERSGGFAFHVSGDFAGLELKFWAVRD